MKITHFIIFFGSLFWWKTIQTDSGQNMLNDDYSLETQKNRRSSKNSKISQTTAENSPETDPDEVEDLSLGTEDHEAQTQRSIQIYTNEWEPNVYQHLKVPVGGPYCYPEKADYVSNYADSPRKFVYTPELREKGTVSYPIGITDIVWPYEPDQTSREKETRKFIRLNVSEGRYEDTYRYISKDAERAFISRYYGFINPTEKKFVDELIAFIEDFKKYAARQILDTSPDPLVDFNFRSDEEKVNFCEKHINYNLVLLNEGIDFDSFSDTDEIIRKKITVYYNHSQLKSITDTLEVVECPCIQDFEKPLKLGVLPIRYKFEQEFSFAFVYNILKNSEEESIEDIANVRALVKIDEKGLAKKRAKRDQELENLLKLKEKEQKKSLGKEKRKNDENADETSRWNRVLKRLHIIRKPFG